jgi:transmembrane sensor
MMNTEHAERTQTNLAATAATQAAEWYVAQRGAGLSMAQQRLFVEWLRLSPLHVREYLAVAGLTQDFKQLAGSMDLPALLEQSRRQPDGEVLALPARAAAVAAPRSRPRAVQWTAAAALGAVILTASLVWQLFDTVAPGDLLRAQGLQNMHGEQRVWRLPDGSVAHLNSGSALQLHFSATERRVEVLRGQALFDVAPERQRPFRVVAGSVDVVAVGTSFDVYRKPQGTVVTVVSGKVNVFARPAVTGAATARQAQPLAAGEQAQVAAKADAPQVKRVDVARVVAWTQQQIMFDQEPLLEVANEFNRYGRVPLEIRDPALAQLKITGIFNAYDTESFVGFLRRMEGVTVHTSGDAIVISKNSGT